MSGIAIVIQGVDFSSLNLGKVHLPDVPVPLESLSIQGSDIVRNADNQETYTVAYDPIYTTETGVVWSLISGSEYANIDSETGLLTVLDGANLDEVIIRATSTVNSDIYDEKIITVTYVVHHDCSLEVSLLNGDFVLHDWDNDIDVEPGTIRYLTSDSTGTSFNRQPGMGTIYKLPNKDIKTISFEYYYDTIKSGTMSNSWGGLFALILDKHHSMNILQSIIVTNKYPDDGCRYTCMAQNDSSSNVLDTATNAAQGVWHRVCLNSNLDYTKFGTPGIVTFDVYVDGTKLGQIYSNYSLISNAYDLKIILGNSWRLDINGSSSTDANPMCGKMKNIRMFRRQLTNEEAIAESTLSQN